MNCLRLSNERALYHLLTQICLANDLLLKTPRGGSLALTHGLLSNFLNHLLLLGTCASAGKTMRRRSLRLKKKVEMAFQESFHGSASIARPRCGIDRGVPLKAWTRLFEISAIGSPEQTLHTGSCASYLAFALPGQNLFYPSPSSWSHSCPSRAHVGIRVLKIRLKSLSLL